MGKYLAGDLWLFGLMDLSLLADIFECIGISFGLLIFAAHIFSLERISLCGCGEKNITTSLTERAALATVSFFSTFFLLLLRLVVKLNSRGSRRGLKGATNGQRARPSETVVKVDSEAAGQRAAAA